METVFAYLNAHWVAFGWLRVWLLLWGVIILGFVIRDVFREPE